MHPTAQHASELNMETVNICLLVESSFFSNQVGMREKIQTATLPFVDESVWNLRFIWHQHTAENRTDGMFRASRHKETLTCIQKREQAYYQRTEHISRTNPAKCAKEDGGAASSTAAAAAGQNRDKCAAFQTRCGLSLSLSCDPIRSKKSSYRNTMIPDGAPWCPAERRLRRRGRSGGRGGRGARVCPGRLQRVSSPRSVSPQRRSSISKERTERRGEAEQWQPQLRPPTTVSPPSTPRLKGTFQLRADTVDGGK